MELIRIASLIEKYNQANTTIDEENELKMFFLSSNVPSHLQEYSTLFGFYENEKQEKYTKQLLFVTKNKAKKWLSVAAAVLVVFGTATYFIRSNPKTTNAGDLGSYKNPSQAIAETQKALFMLSHQLNKGIKSVNYITEYQKSKERVFKN